MLAQLLKRIPEIEKIARVEWDKGARVRVGGQFNDYLRRVVYDTLGLEQMPDGKWVLPAQISERAWYRKEKREGLWARLHDGVTNQWEHHRKGNRK